MAEKYRLIREYPGSPKLGAIVELKNNGGYELENFTSYFMTKDKVENYPEFWERIIEYKPGDKVYRIWENGDRTLGIIVESGIAKYNNLRFKALENYNDLGGVCKGDVYGLGGYKYEKVNILFTTEDGVDIYENQDFYELITPNFHNKSCIWNILPVNSRSNIIYDQEGNRKNGRIWFSTKEAAEEYVLWNKPCLSINDLEELNNIKKSFQSLGSLSITRNKLKELVKQKLK